MSVQECNIVNDPLASQFQNMSIENDNVASNETHDSTVVQNLQRNSGNRSFSDAGLYANPFMPSASAARSQTAPMASANLFGFNFPFNSLPVFYPYGNTMNSNLMLTTQVNSDENLRPFTSSATTNLSQTNSLLTDNASTANVNNVANNENPSTTPVSTPSINVITSNANGPALSPRQNLVYQTGNFPHSPSPNISYILVPQFGTPLQNSSTNMPYNTSPRTSPNPYSQSQLTALSESPEVETSNSKASSASSDVKNPLSINVEYNDNTAHNWHPQANGSATLNYPYVPPNFPFSQNDASPFLSHHSPKTDEQMVSPNIPVSPFFWSSPSVPMFPVTSFSYQQPGYFQVPSPDIFQAVNQQSHMMDYLNSKMSRLDQEISVYETEIQTIQQQLKNRSNLPKKEDLQKEISDLQTECLRLNEELDRRSGEAALTESGEDFYSTINTGQQGSLLPKLRKVLRKSSLKALKHSKKHYDKVSQESNKKDSEDDSHDINRWACSHCTYLNYPSMEYCEICQKSKTSTLPIS